LPDRFLSGFSGFTSTLANNYAVKCATYCTKLIMRDLNVLPDNIELGIEPKWKEEDEDFIG
jgi:hypothetical protein